MFCRTARRSNGSSSQSGYMLLLLMLAVALLTITMLSVATNYRQSIRRDREVEMIHRGVQYERAVRLYYRKNSSYPPSVERLLESNKIRYLRKEYKDPFTPDGKWRIAHLTDINLPAGATGLGTAGASGTGGSSGGAGNASTAATETQQGGQQSGATGAPSGGASPESGAQPTATTGAEGAAPNGTSTGTSSGTAGANQGSSTGPGDQGPTGTANTGPASTMGGAGELLGGGAMIGVVSKSKQEGIHSFNEKTRYNEWLFVYLPSQDTASQPGHIPTAPFNPKAITTTGVVGQSGLTTPGSTQGTPMPGTTTPTTTTPTAGSKAND